MAGSLKELNIGGYPFGVTSDSDPSVTIGGRVIVETQRNTKGITVVTEESYGKIVALTGQWELGSSDQTLFDALKVRSANGEKLPASFTTADGATFNSTGVALVVPNAVDGQFTAREGKTEFELHCLTGKFVRAN